MHGVFCFTVQLWFFFRPRMSFKIFVFCICLLIVKTETSETAKRLCGLTTDELLKYYGYKSEIHTIQTEDGYILTAFRCNSNTTTLRPKKPVLVQHGLLTSSDDFCISPPGRGLAYVLADAGYDVWLLNSRGNVYSRRHIFKDPNDSSSNFWNFSWYEMGIYDQAAVIDYVLKVTQIQRVYYVGHSQGSTSLMVLLSEKPEYNSKISAASLMAPAAFMNQHGIANQLWAISATLSPLIPIVEFLPRRNIGTKTLDVLCGINYVFCNAMTDFISGPSENQRDSELTPVFICHSPNGISVKQIFHYGQSIIHGTFGKYSNDGYPVSDFPLFKITAPISLHISVYDTIIYPTGVNKLIPKLSNSVQYIQIINETKYNHADFLYGVQSNCLVYSKILTFFNNFK